MMQIGLSLGIRYWKELLFIGAVFLMSIVFLFFCSWTVSQQQSLSGTCNQTAATLSGNGNNIQQSWEFFSKNGGFNPAPVAGILGNLMVESAGTFDPNIQQYGGGPGRGLAQWSLNGRWQDLVRYASSEGLSPTSLQAQLNFILVEMRSGRYGNYGSDFNQMSVTDAASYFEAKYESAGDPHMDSRISYATQFYNQFAISSVTVTSSSQPVITNICGGSITGNASDKAKKVIAYAEQFLGVPYVWGGTTPSGFDCSGLMQYVFRSVGVNLPRVSQDQQMVGTRISPSQVQPGDLVFMGFPAFHVGMYIGGGKWIEAPQTGDVVKIANYNPASFTSAARVLN